MNLLAVGAGRYDAILEHLPSTFLLVDDGTLIDQLELPTRRKITHFNFETNSFDVLKDIDYAKAANLVDVIEAAFPAGQNTLTKQDSAVVLLESLVSSPRTLDTLLPPPKKTDPLGQVAAYRKIQRLLLSPILRPILTRHTNFSLRGILLARLPTTIPRFDRFILGNLLVSLYGGTVVLPDFGFYACDLHHSLIEQGRLVAGLNFLGEVDRKMQNHLLLIETKKGRRTTPDDAETLVQFSGLRPGSFGYRELRESYMA